MNKLLNHLRIRSERLYITLKTFFKWLLLSGITGICCGVIGSLFHLCMEFATEFRTGHSFMVYFLPVAGLVIVFLYSICGLKNDPGTNIIITSIRTEGKIPVRMAPLIFISAFITHLFGGSAGREGAALQLGGSIGNQLGRWFKFDDADKRVVVLCGMSAAFSAVFGTPMAAAVFSMEVVSIGIMYYAALVPCVFSSLIASYFATNFGVRGEDFTFIKFPSLTFLNTFETVCLSILCAGISIAFCIMLHKTSDLLRKYLKNPYIRIFLAGLVVVGLTLLFNTRDYNGAGIPVITKALKGEAVPYAFILKMIFTAITIGAGFRGGEIVPTFFIGATFGCLFGNIVGFSPSVCAAVGLIALFCGVTNCPITSILISFELFGAGGIPFFMIAVAISYFMSGYYGLYHDQTIVYSKYKTKYVNRHTK